MEDMMQSVQAAPYWFVHLTWPEVAAMGIWTFAFVACLATFIAFVALTVSVIRGGAGVKN